MRLLNIIALSVVGIPMTAFSTPIQYNHKIPGDFRVSCKTRGDNKKPSRADFVWDSKSKKMIITGDSIDGDNGRLIEGRGYNSARTISTYSDFWKGQDFPSLGITRPDIRTQYMTFKEEDERSPDSRSPETYHIRSFIFQVRDGELGSVETNDISYTEGVIRKVWSGILRGCEYRGIYATP